MLEKGENNLVEWIRGHVTSVPRDGVLIDIGDDMAMLELGSERLLVASDMLMDGVDFDARIHVPERIGRKAIAVNLSDCAAMAARPAFALVSVALNDAWGMDEARRLFAGMQEIASKFGCIIVGGDTNSWSQPLAIDVTLLARPIEGIEPVRRSGALPGDALYVSGPLGGSLAGHHLDFVPRVRAAEALARILGADLHAMMDLSDGLSTDGHRMAAASGCGLLLEAAALTHAASDAARRNIGDSGRQVLDHVLNDGEDFELLFAARRGRLERLAAGEIERLTAAGLDEGFPMRIGEVIEARDVCLRHSDGRLAPIQAQGWQHFR